MKRCLPPALAAAAVFAAFWPALSGDWLRTWDDNVNFLDNPHYRGLGASNLAWMFSNAVGHYMPLTWISLGLDYELWGMNAAGYHFTNVLLHAVNTILAFGLLRAFLRRRGVEGPAADWAALGGALLYGLHPARVESVAWITERRDLMAGLFFIPSVTAYLKATGLPEGTPERRKAFALSLGLFACSLLSKTIGMTLPAALLALDAALGRFARGADGRVPWRALLLEKGPYAALMLAGMIMTAAATDKAGSFDRTVAPSAAQVLGQPGVKLASYLSKTAAPVGLSPLYAYRPPRSLFEAPTLLSSAAVLGLTAVLWALRRRWPGALASWIGFAALLAPVCSPLQAGPHVTADRYTYLAGLAPAFLAAGALAALASRPRLAVAAAAVVLSAAGIASHRYSRVWRSSEALWTRAIEADPDYGISWANRGAGRMLDGRLPEAKADLDEAIRLLPRQALPRVNRADVKLRLKDAAGAWTDVNEAVAIAPGYAAAYLIRGRIEESRGRLAEAEADFSRALGLDPLLVDAYVERATVRGRTGRLKEAFEDCSRALAIKPFSAKAYLNRGVARGELGDLDGALADYAAALRENPRLPEAWGGRGMCLALKGRWAEAAESFERALETATPDWPFREDTRRRLAEARARLGR